MDTSVSRETGPDRFQITAEGDVAGFAEFVDHGDRDEQRIFFHTVIEERFGGQGLASTVVGHALAATRGEGRRIVPVCTFVQQYVAKHPEFADVTDPVTDEALAAVRGS